MVTQTVSDKEKSKVAQITETINSNTTQTEFNVYQPGEFKVIRRNGKVTAFDPSKVGVALTKAFLSVEGRDCSSFQSYS